MGYLAYQASRSIRLKIGSELTRKGYPITADQFSVLVYIWDLDGQSQRVLAEKVYRNKAMVTRALAAIEQLGLIERIPGQDAREKLVFLTKPGRELMEEVTKLVQKVLQQAQKGIDSEEISTCKDVLRRIRQNLV